MIVDDQAVFRDAARRLLEWRGYAVVAEAGCRSTALAAVARHTPEAVLLDVRLGDDNGFEVCGALTRALPHLAVLLVSDADYEECGQEVAFSGARGFVRKSRLPKTDLGEFWPRAG